MIVFAFIYTLARLLIFTIHSIRFKNTKIVAVAQQGTGGEEHRGAEEKRSRPEVMKTAFVA